MVQTGTCLAGLHYPDRWPSFVTCLLEGRSLRDTAARLGVHVSTAFRWRHRFLGGLGATSPPRLGGIVEVSEVYLAESRKGQRRLPRAPRRRAVDRLTLPRSRAVCVLVARDRSARAFLTVAGPGLPDAVTLDLCLAPHLALGSIVCPPRPQSYRQFCRRHRFVDGYVNVKARPLQRKFQHRYTSAAMARRWLTWMARFYGVATRYLQNYLAWYQFLERAPMHIPIIAHQRMFLDILTR